MWRGLGRETSGVDPHMERHLGRTRGLQGSPPPDRDDLVQGVGVDIVLPVGGRALLLHRAGQEGRG